MKNCYFLGRRETPTHNLVICHAMPSYCLPAIEKKPINIILHCRTSDISSDKSEVKIATDLLAMAYLIEAKDVDVIISGLV